MADKRYYWLKLQEDFFKSKRIKKLRKIAGGDTYTIIYLKMQLLSIRNKGILEYSGLEPSFAEEIALDIDEEIDDVTITINYLLNTGLMETADNKEYMLPFAVGNIGSESESAERVRQFRERESKALHCNEPVTKCNHNVLSISNSISKSSSISSSKYKGERFFPDDKLNEAFKDYIENRKNLKKPMTEKAIELALTKLAKLSNGDNDKAIEILNQSILNGWTGLFELKQNKQQKGIDWDSV